MENKLTKNIVIKAYVDGTLFSANNMFGSIQVLEYSFVEFISWCLGNLTLALGAGGFRDELARVIQYSHLWFLYGIFIRTGE